MTGNMVLATHDEAASDQISVRLSQKTDSDDRSLRSSSILHLSLCLFTICVNIPYCKYKFMQCRFK